MLFSVHGPVALHSQQDWLALCLCQHCNDHYAVAAASGVSGEWDICGKFTAVGEGKEVKWTLGWQTCGCDD